MRREKGRGEKEKNGKVIKWPVVEGDRGEKRTPLEYENNETKAQLLARWWKNR